MQKAAEMPYTLTIRKKLTSGNEITFSGWRAQRFAGKILENVIILNGSVKEEKKEISRSLSVLIKSGEALIAAPQESKDARMEQYARDLRAYWNANQMLHLKLKSSDYIGMGLPESAARQRIMDEHLPTLISKISSLGNFLIQAVRENEYGKASRWLHTLKDGAERTDALFDLLDRLEPGSIWEIKALTENACTRAALHQIGVETGVDAKKAEHLRASAAHLEQMCKSAIPGLESALAPILMKIKGATQETPASEWASYALELRGEIEPVRALLGQEREKIAGLADDDPRRIAFSVVEHHTISAISGMAGLMSILGKRPDMAGAVAKSAANLLRFLEIASRVREADDPHTLAHVFKSGNTVEYLEKLGKEYTA